MSSTEKDVVLVIDVGTTNIKVGIIDKQGELLRLESKPLRLISPNEGWYEISPDILWADLLTLIRSVSAPFRQRILTVGLTTQRGTFISWDLDTGRYLHNFITWMDMRTTELCRYYNENLLMKMGRYFLWFFGTITNSNFLTCASTFQLKEGSVQARCKWIINNIPTAKEVLKKNKLQLATIDAWLVYKLTGAGYLATDYTSASGTGIYDMWELKWCPIQAYTFNIPYYTLPDVKVSDAFYGNISEHLNLGFSCPITGLIGDQQSSIVGNQVLDSGEMKLTIGTVSSANIITGSFIHPTANVIYPQIAYKLYSKDVAYMAECLSIGINTGRCINWLVDSGILKDIKDFEDAVTAVDHSDGVVFTAKIKNGSDVTSCVGGGCFVGISSSTTIQHLVRAVAEHQIFQCKSMIDNLIDAYQKPKRIMVDGGVSKSNFIVSSLANLCQLEIRRLNSGEGGLIGAFCVAGLGMGLWKDIAELRQSISIDHRVFIPDKPSPYLISAYKKWKIAHSL